MFSNFLLFQPILKIFDRPTIKEPLVITDPCATGTNVPSSSCMTLLSLTALFIALVSSLQFM